MECASESPDITNYPLLATPVNQEGDPNPTGTDDPEGIVDERSTKIAKILNPDPGGYNWLSPM